MCRDTSTKTQYDECNKMSIMICEMIVPVRSTPVTKLLEEVIMVI
jgi:hypothetical protein